jgi:hypothetical protein
MEPHNIRFGGGPSLSVLHPLVAVAMIIAVILILTLARKSVIVPLLLSLMLVPKGQQIVVAALHFNVYRIVILAALARLAMASRPRFPAGFTFMDRIVTIWAIAYYVMNNLLYLQTQATIKATGDLLDALGGYFVIRFLITDMEDIRRAIKVLVSVAIVNAVCMLNEQRTGYDLFSLLGGMPEETFRDGKIRSQGAFEVFITAGAYGATVMPLFIWLFSQAGLKVRALLGMLAATVMAVTCFASTTLTAYAAGILGLCLWPIRKNMRLVRWSIVLVLLGLQVVMNGPVWSILEHVDLTGSSSSYHRYMLIDNLIRHFSEWWLIGTTNNGSWGWMMWDASNQYVAYALSGGLLTLVLFIALISKSFARLGKARKLIQGNKKQEWLLWCLGAAVFSHVVAFFGIGYFDQVQFAWFTLLSFISVAVFEANHSVAPQTQNAGFSSGFALALPHSLQEAEQ